MLVQILFQKKIRIFKETLPNYVRFIKNFTPEDYIRVLKNSKCIVGNSSSGIREASFGCSFSEYWNSSIG